MCMCVRGLRDSHDILCRCVHVCIVSVKSWQMNDRSSTLSSSTTVSANPTTYIATATALAKAKIKPIAPPNSGPRLLEIK